MTPGQKIKHLILLAANRLNDVPAPTITADNVDAEYRAAYDQEELYEAIQEVRGSGEPTGLKCDWSRHYESQAVAVEYIDGSWVGFTYWYGGGKHGEPESIDWMDDAYAVTATQETRIVNVFARAEEAA